MDSDSDYEYGDIDITDSFFGVPEREAHVPERGAHERTAAQPVISDFRTPLGLFQYGITQAFERISVQMQLPESMLNDILRAALFVTEPAHKNAPSFVYAYVLLSRNKSDGLKHAFGTLQNLEDYSISKPDVLRYIRMLQSNTHMGL